jgi:hypothetical protein
MENDDYFVNITSIGSSTTLPSTANVGDIWLDTSNNSILTYDSSQWITISSNDINIDTLSFPSPIEWEHEFPAFHKVEEMCKDYPALEKAYENFKTIYKMVEQDYIGKKRDEDSPF